MDELINKWAAERQLWLVKVAIDHGLEIEPGWAERIVAEEKEAILAILRDGLDIGGIVKHVVPVTLSKHEQHGWVFQLDSGEMFRVSDHIK